MKAAALLSLGDEEVYGEDLHDIALYLLDTDHHASAAALAILNEGLPVELRTKYCSAVVAHLLAHLEPKMRAGPLDQQTTVRFMRECKPYLMDRWGSHIRVYRTGSGVPQAVYVSSYLRSILAAAGVLFRVPGHLEVRHAK